MLGPLLRGSHVEHRVANAASDVAVATHPKERLMLRRGNSRRAQAHEPEHDPEKWKSVSRLRSGRVRLDG
jgi:hypothetical protein